MDDKEGLRNTLDGYIGTGRLPEFNREIDQRLTDIYSLPWDQQSPAYDALLQDLPGMMADLNVFDRVTASDISTALKRIYDQDAGHVVNDPSDAPNTNRRAIELMEMRKRVNEANRRFGVLELATRRYVTPLFPTAGEAENTRIDRDLDESDYRVQEHFGEGWEPFLLLNQPLDRWNDYIEIYHETILAKLTDLDPLPLGRLPTATETGDDHDDADQGEGFVPRERPKIRPTVAPSIKVSGNILALDPVTGIQQRIDGSSMGSAVVAASDVRTGERDDRRRSLTVPANLNGLAQWVESTYRTYGDTVTTVRSAQGGVISLTIVGDINLWRQRTMLMRIPAPLEIVADDNARTLTISYA